MLKAIRQASTSSMAGSGNCTPKPSVTAAMVVTCPITASQRSLKRGRGLTMINGLADDVKTVRSGAGTRVTLTFEGAVLAGAGVVKGVTP